MYPRGGLLAVTYTDIVQMLLLILGIVVIAVPMTTGTLASEGLSLKADLPRVTLTSAAGAGRR